MAKAPSKSPVKQAETADAADHDDDEAGDGAPAVAAAVAQIPAQPPAMAPASTEKVRFALMATRLVPWGFAASEQRQAGDVVMVWEAMTEADARFVFQRLGFSAFELIPVARIADRRAEIVAAAEKVKAQAAREQERREADAKALEERKRRMIAEEEALAKVAERRAQQQRDDMAQRQAQVDQAQARQDQAAIEESRKTQAIADGLARKRNVGAAS